MSLEDIYEETRSLLSQNCTEDIWVSFQHTLRKVNDYSGAELDMFVRYVKEHTRDWFPTYDISDIGWNATVGKELYRISWSDFLSQPLPLAWRLCLDWELGDTNMRDDDLISLLTLYPELRYRGLNLESNKLTEESLRMLFEGEYLAQCEYLDFQDITLSTKTMESLVACESLSRLRWLILSSAELQPAGLKLLAQASNLESLEYISFFYSYLEGRGLKELMSGPLLSQVQRLNLYGNGIGAPTLCRLFSHLEHVRWLDIGNNQINISVIRALVASHLPEQLLSLHLGGCDSYGRNVVELLADTPFPHLESLYLFSSRIGDAGLSALIQSHSFGSLQRLYLSQTDMTSLGLASLLSSDLIKQLEVLVMDSNDFGVEGARHLAECEHLTSLRELGVAKTELDEVGMLLLMESSYLCRLETLNVGYNELSPRGLSALFCSEKVPQLRHLCLDRVIGSHSRHGKELADAPYAHQLVSLSLHDADWTNGAMQDMARSDAFVSLRELHLGGLPLNRKSIRALTRAEWFSQLHTLHCPDCSSDDQSYLRDACHEVGVKWVLP